MDARVANNIQLLKIIGSVKQPTKLRKAILRHCDIDLIKCLSEISHNVLEGRLKLTPRQAGSLRRYRQSLRKLAAIKTKLPTKRRLLEQQSGGQAGGLPVALLAPILGIALSLLADRLTK